MSRATVKKTKPKTEELGLTGQGVAPVKIKAIDKLAGEYVGFRDTRIEALTSEIATKNQLREAMHFHEDKLKQPDGTLVYMYDDVRISLVPGKEKLKVEEIPDVEVHDAEH